MDTKRIVISIFKTIISICFIIVICIMVYRFGVKGYDFGYRIFAEEPVAPEPGYTMSVAILEGKSVMEIGTILEEKGLIRDHNLFYFQELFSNYHGKIQPGVYELNTSMTTDEMIAIMASEAEEDSDITEDETENGDDLTVSENGIDMNNSDGLEIIIEDQPEGNSDIVIP